MKKLLLLLALALTCNIVHSQDGYKLSPETYETIKSKIIDIDSITAKNFADDIASSAKTGFTYLKTKEDAKDLRYYYTPNDATEAEKEDREAFGSCMRCMIVYFKKYNKGANEDLEIEGTPMLYFSMVSGSYLDLFPIWKKEFLNAATPELALDNFRYRDVKYIPLNLDVRLSKMNGLWTIKNLY